MGDSPGGTPPYKVVDIGAGVVVEGHGRPEVSVIEKSGFKPNVLVACDESQANCLAAYDEGLQKFTYTVKKKEEEQLSEH